MEFIGKKIRLNKPLTELDLLVLKFIRILEKYVNYVVISGYVSILLGRTRSTEDVDIYIRYLSEDKFLELVKEIYVNDFYCLNTDNPNDMYDYLKEGLAVRFAEKGQIIPNFEVKFAKKIIDTDLFEEALEVETEAGIIKISSLERQIAFKKYYLSSVKDLEDASYVEEIARGYLNQEKIKKYKELIKILMKDDA